MKYFMISDKLSRTTMKALWLRCGGWIEDQEHLQIIFRVILDQANWILILLLIHRFIDENLILDLRIEMGLIIKFRKVIWTKRIIKISLKILMIHLMLHQIKIILLCLIKIVIMRLIWSLKLKMLSKWVSFQEKVLKILKIYSQFYQACAKN